MKTSCIILAAGALAPANCFAQVPITKPAPPVAPTDTGAGQTVLLETWNNNSRNWRIAKDVTDLQADIVAGAYQVTTGAKRTFSAMRSVRFDENNAFSLALSVKNTPNAAQGAAGLMFGASVGGNSFALLVTPRQKWTLLQFEEGKPKRLVPLTMSGLLNAGGSNIVSIKSAKGVWTIYLNGEAVQTLPAIPFYGPGLGVFQTSEQTISFDDLRVQSWPAGVSYRVSPDERQFRPADFKPAPVESKPPVVAKLDARGERPFGTKAYSAPDDFTVEAIRVMTSRAGEGTLKWGKDFRFTGQRGTNSKSPYAMAVEYGMGDFPSFEAARDVAGPMLVAARTAFGDKSVYFASDSPPDDLKEDYYVASTDSPRLRARTEISSEGRFDGSVFLTFSLELLGGDPGPKDDPRVQKSVPQRKPFDPATFPPRLSLGEALKKILADAPNQFASVSTKQEGDLPKGTVRIQGVRDEFQSVISIPPIAIYSFSFGFDSTKEEALQNVETLTPIIVNALGDDVKVSTSPDGKGFKTTFSRGAGAFIEIQSSANTIGEGYTQSIDVHNQ